MSKIFKLLETMTSASVGIVNLLWRWILNTALITMVVGLAVFLPLRTLRTTALPITKSF